MKRNNQFRNESPKSYPFKTRNIILPSLTNHIFLIMKTCFETSILNAGFLEAGFVFIYSQILFVWRVMCQDYQLTRPFSAVGSSSVAFSSDTQPDSCRTQPDSWSDTAQPWRTQLDSSLQPQPTLTFRLQGTHPVQCVWTTKAICQWTSAAMGAMGTASEPNMLRSPFLFGLTLKIQKVQSGSTMLKWNVSSFPSTMTSFTTKRRIGS